MLIQALKTKFMVIYYHQKITFSVTHLYVAREPTVISIFHYQEIRNCGQIKFSTQLLLLRSKTLLKINHFSEMINMKTYEMFLL